DPAPVSDDVIAALKELLQIEPECTDTKQLAVVAFLYIYSIIFINKSDPPSIAVEMKSDIPVGAGLGSSAAFSVALSSALLQLSGVVSSEKVSDNVATWPSADLDTINKYAFLGEKMIHGQPSGIDNSISTYVNHTATMILNWKTKELLNFLSIPTLKMMLVNTKVPRSTKTLVSNFRQLYNTVSITCEQNSVYIAIPSVGNVLAFLMGFHIQALNLCPQELMDMNHQFLNLMGVGHPSLDQVMAEARKSGFHGKLTGAGGGGCAIILLPPGADLAAVTKLEEQLITLGFQVFSNTSFGGRGVIQHL
ncbi:hypothetical protein EGW08_014697, partial [Elysia chlorotica]